MGADLEKVLEDYHRAIEAVIRGDPAPQERLWSRRDDVTLANPPRSTRARVDRSVERSPPRGLSAQRRRSAHVRADRGIARRFVGRGVACDQPEALGSGVQPVAAQHLPHPVR